MLGFMLGGAFIFWGAEQYLGNAALVSLVDDIVVLLFVST